VQVDSLGLKEGRVRLNLLRGEQVLENNFSVQLQHELRRLKGLNIEPVRLSIQRLHKTFPSDREVLGWVFLASLDRELLLKGRKVDRAVDLGVKSRVCGVGKAGLVGQGVLEIRCFEVGGFQTAFLGQLDHS
jgi:hypothetical protein